MGKSQIAAGCDLAFSMQKQTSKTFWRCRHCCGLFCICNKPQTGFACNTICNHVLPHGFFDRNIELCMYIYIYIYIQTNRKRGFANRNLLRIVFPMDFGLKHRTTNPKRGFAWENTIRDQLRIVFSQGFWTETSNCMYICEYVCIYIYTHTNLKRCFAWENTGGVGVWDFKGFGV